MNSRSSILLLFVFATINDTSAFVLPKISISPSPFRTKVANEPTLLHESTEIDESIQLNESTVEEDIIPSVEEKIDPRARLEPGRHDDIDYSIAFPSLFKRPPNLDGSHAGDYGFDPLDLSEKYDLYYMQECEIRHARLAMLAVVGWPMSELIAPNWMLRDGCAPSVLNGFNPLTFLVTVAAFGAFGFLEYNTALRRIKGTKLGDTHLKDMELIWKYGVAGDYNWDPQNLYSILGDDAAGRKGLRTLEITQGRYAMLGITYFVLWEAITHSPIVKNSIFFHPNLALPFLAVVYFAWSQIFQFRPISEMLSNEQIEIEYTKDGEQMLQDWTRLTKGPRNDLAIKFKEVTGGIELPKELEETGSELGTTLDNLIKGLKDDGKVTTTSLAGGVAGLSLLIATALSNPFGGDSNKPAPPAAKKVVSTVTVPKNPSPKFTAPELPKFAAPELPKFAAPQVPSMTNNNDNNGRKGVKETKPADFVAPELPKFDAPELPKFTAPELPKFTAPELPKFTAPELPKVKAPDFSVPEYTAPELDKKEVANPVIVEETKTDAVIKATPELPKFTAPELPKFTAPGLPKFTAPELPKVKAPDFSVPEYTAPELDKKEVADPVIVEETKTDAVIKATPTPPSPGTVAREDSKAALEESRKAAQERRERAAEEYAQRRADSKAAIEASRKASQERRERAAEEFAKRKAENREALEKVKAQQKEQEAERAAKYNELSKALKAKEAARLEELEQQKTKIAAERADTQANFNKRSYFGDSTVMGDDVQGGKLLPKEEVSSEVKEILKLYTK